MAKNKIKSSSVSFSTTLSPEAKVALTRFCLKRGLKINSFLEEMIWDRLEDEMDMEIADSTDTSELTDLKKFIV